LENISDDKRRKTGVSADKRTKKAAQYLKSREICLRLRHHVTFNKVLGNNLTIYNGIELRIICSECGY